MNDKQRNYIIARTDVDYLFRFIKEDGGDLDGYVKRYGAILGQQVYDADVLALAGYEQALDEAINALDNDDSSTLIYTTGA